MNTNKYLITYSHDGEKETKVIRRACSSWEAIEKLTNQYKWSWKIGLVDAETRGVECCEGYVDRDGGINYNMRIVATIESDTCIDWCGDKTTI